MSQIRWDVLTIGHLSRNKFWGESDAQAYRTPRCTTTLIRAGGEVILVDPSLPPDEMARVLGERTGLTPAAIKIVALTHFHGDHRVGLEAYAHARWLMPEAEYRDCLAGAGPERALLERITPVQGELVPGITLLPTPGHTRGHASLAFLSDGLRVIVAGDAVMTRDFFLARDYYFNTADPAAALESIDRVAALADVIVPGHDNLFIVGQRLSEGEHDIGTE